MAEQQEPSQPPEPAGTEAGARAGDLAEDQLDEVTGGGSSAPVHIPHTSGTGLLGNGGAGGTAAP